MQQREAGRWWRWSVAALGLVGVAASTAFVAGGRTVASVDVYGVGVPLVVSAAVLGFGGWLAREYEPREVRRVAGWAAGGLCALGLLGTWEFSVHVLDRMEPAAAVHLVLSSAAVGAGVGTLVGRYDVHQRRERKRGERAHKALSASMDGIAILDEDGEYVTVNEAHAEVYGYDDPEAFVGETWRMCYADEELERFEEGVIPTLFETGSWRGTAVGTRADGTQFHQELSLSAMEDGGLVCVVRDVDDRVERERKLSDLHEATREMVRETETDAICERAVDAAERVLDLPVTGIWLADETEACLRPAGWSDAATDLFGEQPTFEAGESLSWAAFEDGEPRVYDDVSEHPDRHSEETPIRAEMILPVGDHGVLNVGATEPGRFDEGDALLGRLLAANTAVALNRAERERELRTRTDQMEFFTSILRHDVLNGMTVIRARAEMLADELDGEHEQFADTIVDWSDDVTDVVERVRAVLETLTGTSDREFAPVDLSAVVDEECARVRQTYPEVTVESDVPGGVVVLADDLLAEIVGNLVTNAVEHNDPEDLRVRVEVEADDEWATLRVADDGRGVPEGDREDVFRRGETGHAKSTGTGFGLFFVDAMVTAYGGSVEVEDNDAGGATFVVELPTPETPSADRPAAGQEP